MSKHQHILLIGVPDGTLKYCIPNDVKLSLIVNHATHIDEELLPRLNKIIKCNITDPLLCLFYTKELHFTDPIDSVITFLEYGIETAAITKVALGIKGVELLPTIFTKYKSMMREQMQQHCPDLSLPYQIVKNKDDIKKFLIEMQSSIVVKPINGMGSIGIKKICNSDDIINLDIDLSNNKYLAELYISGDEIYHSETISFNNQHYLIAMGLQKFNKNLVATESIIPVPNLSSNQISSIFKQISIFLNTMQLNNGIAHTEFKLHQGKVYIIETQTRIGGGYIWYMSQEYTKYRQMEMCIKLFAGQTIIPPEPFNPDSGVIYHSTFITPLKAGKISKIYGLELIKSHPNVSKWILRVTEGMVVLCNHDATDYLGFIVLKCRNNTELCSVKASLENKFYFMYEDGEILKIFN